jgi:hypothetical protein
VIDPDLSHALSDIKYRKNPDPDLMARFIAAYVESPDTDNWPRTLRVEFEILNETP